MVKKTFLAVLLLSFVILSGCSLSTLSGVSTLAKASEPPSNNNENKAQDLKIETKTDKSMEDMKIKKQEINTAGSIEKKEENKKIVLLTFDDGPSVITGGFLDVLKENNVQATFCLIGERAAAFKDIVKREHLEGHSVINHSNTHNLLEIYKTPDIFINNIDKCNSTLNSIIDRSDIEKKFARFPGGYDTTYMNGSRKGISEYMKSRGYDTLEWNISSGDCATGKATADYIYKNSINDKDNDVVVILMHDFKYRQTTLEALPKIIKHYKDKGYQFKTIKDLSAKEIDKLVSKKIVNKIFSE